MKKQILKRVIPAIRDSTLLKNNSNFSFFSTFLGGGKDIQAFENKNVNVINLPKKEEEEWKAFLQNVSKLYIKKMNF